MPTIRSSTDLRNHYNEISALCHESNEPVYITKNGKGDLVVMSIEFFDEHFGKFSPYKLFPYDINDVKDGHVSPLKEATE